MADASRVALVVVATHSAGLSSSSGESASRRSVSVSKSMTSDVAPEDAMGYQISTGRVRPRLLSVRLAVATPTDAGPGAV